MFRLWQWFQTFSNRSFMTSFWAKSSKLPHPKFPSALKMLEFIHYKNENAHRILFQHFNNTHRYGDDYWWHFGHEYFFKVALMALITLKIIESTLEFYVDEFGCCPAF